MMGGSDIPITSRISPSLIYHNLASTNRWELFDTVVDDVLIIK